MGGSLCPRSSFQLAFVKERSTLVRGKKYLFVLNILNVQSILSCNNGIMLCLRSIECTIVNLDRNRLKFLTCL